ncbi:hypothetical protein PHMEG_0006189 [Phytophthora megakarya]|uniref:Uncharacterized protein n=1 Tax=Phytophthora megakarya TaxID=4795 RepID=A0A225WR72_9STRA|nr:hypothetical protein PHMEG_0006189 [Phytophthora megakarya]
MYADRPVDFELLVAPIISALSCQADQQGQSTLLFNPRDRKSLLENYLLSDVAVNERVLRDPNKVAFVRRVFKQALDALHNDEDFDSTLKSLWVGFEAEVSRVAGGQEESLTYARGLSQKLAEKTVNGDTDFDVLYAYAKLELVLGNKRQVRRICDSTLKSLTNSNPNSGSVSRHFHRFVFLRARQEMWQNTDDEKKTRDQGRLRLLRCMYILWSWVHPKQPGGKEKETLDEISKMHKKRNHAYLQETLMSDSSIGTNLIAKYREELDFSIRCCVKSTSTDPEPINARSRPHCRAKCWAGYCLHNLALVVYAIHGFEAACNEYRQALTKVEHQVCSQLSWMWACFLEFMQQHQTSGSFPAIAPRLWRSSVGEAVEFFPNNELFLRLFVDSETGNTISQVLRKHFFRVEKRWRRHYDSPELVEWLFAILCEFSRAERAATIKELSEMNNGEPPRPTCCLFHRWGMNTTAVTRLRQMFESMVNQIRTKGNALCWRLYMRFEVALGKVDSAKKILYRGIAACAWSKELYMDGLRVMRAYLNDEECQELFEFMEAKELNLRVDFEE